MTISYAGILSSLIWLSWFVLLGFAYKTLRSSVARQEKVFKLMNQSGFVFLSMPWLANPDLELDNKQKLVLKRKYFRGVKVMAVMLTITALLFLFVGLMNIASDMLAFLIFSLLFAPLCGIIATFYGFMHLLMKKLL